MPHLNPRIDHTVEVFIVCDGKVLLRMHDKHKIWLSVGGHIEPGEDVIEAAHREVREEVGLEIEIIDDQVRKFKDEGELLPCPRYLYTHMITETHRHTTFAYFARSKTTDIKQAESAHEANAECRWCTQAELDAMKDELRENVYFFATEALKAASL